MESNSDDETISTEKLYEFRLLDEEDHKLHSLIRNKQNKIFFNPANKYNTIKNRRMSSDPIPLPANIQEIEQKILTDIESSLGIKKTTQPPPVPPTTPTQSSTTTLTPALPAPTTTTATSTSTVPPPPAPVPPPAQRSQKNRVNNKNSVLQSQTPQAPPAKRISTDIKKTAHTYFERAHNRFILNNL